MEQSNNYEKLQNSLVTIASELFRFQGVFEKAIAKLDATERTKYMSQYAWFSKRVYKALNDSNLKLINPEGQLYDPGMAVTPLNIDSFDIDEPLAVQKAVEPIIMKEDVVIKTGTVLLGRVGE